MIWLLVNIEVKSYEFYVWFVDLFVFFFNNVYLKECWYGVGGKLELSKYWEVGER